MALLNNGDLLVVAFGDVGGQGGEYERALFWRSTNGGRSWGNRSVGEHGVTHGREWSLNVLNDGTILMPGAVIGAGFKPLRSTDNGLHWEEQKLPRKIVDCNYNILEYDGATHFGVSPSGVSHGGEVRIQVKAGTTASAPQRMAISICSARA